MRWPRNQISPDVGASAPTRQEKSVVLPAPFGPMIPKISPAMTSNSIDDRASRPPKRFEIPRTDSSVSGIDDFPRRSEEPGRQRRQPPSDPDEPVRLVEHHENQQPAVDEEKRVAQCSVREKLDLQRADDERPEHRTDDRADSADDRHQDNAQAELKVEDRAGRDVLEVDRVETPRDSDDGSGQRMSSQFEPRGVDSESLRRVDVLFDCGEGTAECAFLDVRSQRDGE